MDRTVHNKRVSLFRSLLAPPPSSSPSDHSHSHPPTKPSSFSDPLVSNLFLPKQAEIDLKYLRKLCSDGVPDEVGIRPTCWKVLLGYLPTDKRQWLEHLSNQRQAYYAFVKDLVTVPGLDGSRTKDRQPGHPPSNHPESDHPLNSESTSNWDAYFKDVAILEQIDIDVRRTHADVAFFQREVTLSPLAHTSSFASPIDSPNLMSIPCSPNSEITMPWGSMSTRTRRGLFRHLEQKGDHTSRERIVPIKTERSLSLTHTADVSHRISHLKPPDSPSTLRRHSQATFHPLTINTTTIDSPSESFSDHELNLEIESISDESELVDKSEQLISQLHHDPDSGIQDLHWEAMERILFIYVKLNPGVGYVQGMNELLGPLYYVCANDVETSWIGGRAHAEADAFYLFTSIMGFVRDQYVKDFDQDALSGAHAALQQLDDRLQFAFPKLAADMKWKGIEPTFYAFRWITVLGTHEFPLPDVIRLWDGLFSYGDSGHPEPVNVMVMVCVAMHSKLYHQLLEGCFSDNIHLLQHFPSVDIAHLLELAFSLNSDYVSGIASDLPEPDSSTSPTRNPPHPIRGLLKENLQRQLDQMKSFVESRDLPNLSSLTLTTPTPSPSSSAPSSTPSSSPNVKNGLAPSRPTKIDLTIPPTYKAKMTQSWLAAKNFLANTHK